MLLLTFTLLFFGLQVSSERIYSNSFNIIKKVDIYHDLPNIFDGQPDSFSNIYLRSNQILSLSIELKEESLIDSVLIIGKFMFFLVFIYILIIRRTQCSNCSWNWNWLWNRLVSWEPINQIQMSKFWIWRIM